MASGKYLSEWLGHSLSHNLSSFFFPVNDDVINMVGQGVGEDWFPLADELNMSNRDKQAVIDIRYVVVFAFKFRNFLGINLFTR